MEEESRLNADLLHRRLQEAFDLSQRRRLTSDERKRLMAAIDEFCPPAGRLESER